MKEDQNNYLYIYFGGILLFLILAFSYYISVNTFFKNKALPNSSINGENISFYTNQDLNQYFAENIQQDIPQYLEVRMDNLTFQVPTQNLNVRLDTEEILSYGKSPNIVETLVKGVSTIKGTQFNPDLKLSAEWIIDAHPYTFNTIESAFIDQDQKINNCKYNNFRINFDLIELERLALDAIQNNKPLITSIENLANNPEETRIIYYCDTYRKELLKIQETFNNFPGMEEFNAESMFALFETDLGPKWRIINRDQLSNELAKYKRVSDIQPKSSTIEYVDNKALILSHSQTGRILNIQDTISNIEIWLENINSNPNFDYDFVTSNQYLENREVLDFTKHISSGNTRIDIVRNGALNWVVPIAQAGVEELHNTIIYPGQEFSFINHVKPRNDNILVMASGRPLGGGTCNSTTTLFRAVLEAGLPITARASHTFYVDSYAWGDYPLNIVDATYYYNPNVDLRFINDFQYPILLKSRIYKGNDGYQYHTIDIFSNSNVPIREVQLTNWRQYNVITPRKFTGSFDRTVIENGKIINTDTFVSKYGDPVEY